MALPIFPVLIGITYPIIKRRTFNTIVQAAVSGIEVRIEQYGAPLYEWDIPYDFLPTADYVTLTNFYESVYGQWASFLFSDPTDNTTAGIVTLGTGDGTTTAFQLLNANGQPIYNVNSLPGAPLIYLSGVLQGSGYTIGSTGLVTFSAAPAITVIVGANFSYYYQVRFADDNTEWENIAGPFWQAKKITLRQVRSAG